jgi:hypothetical protein
MFKLRKKGETNLNQKKPCNSNSEMEVSNNMLVVHFERLAPYRGWHG